MLVITIKGPQNSGKGFIAETIVDALNTKFFKNVSVEHSDGEVENFCVRKPFSSDVNEDNIEARIVILNDM